MAGGNTPGRLGRSRKLVVEVGPSIPSNVDELRARIDAGETGDKVAFPDPAAAPLGTDGEAAGQPPTREEIRLDMLSQSGSPISSTWLKDRIGLLVYCLALLAVGAALVTVVMLA